MSLAPSPKILVIRRDNIGDLVCTTPLITALRQRFPAAWIGALVNSYNAPVLRGNPDLNEVFVYTKGKHRSQGESLPAVIWRRLQMMRRLRSLVLDDVIIATTSPQPRLVKQARWLGAKRVIGFGRVPGLDVELPVDTEDRHEVEDVFRVAQMYGIGGTPPPCRVLGHRANSAIFTVAIHISARKPSQRWPVERFASVMRKLSLQEPIRFLLLWSPGASDNPLHPGDDARAADAMRAIGTAVDVAPTPTERLDELIDALASCQAMICADGGAMHLATGLGLPVVCLFGNSGAKRWRPWGVPYRLLQKPSLDVADISSDEVTAAFDSLRAEIHQRAK